VAAHQAAVGADPHGPVAADLEEALELADDVGAARVLRLALDRARASEAERLGWMLVRTRRLAEEASRPGVR